MGKKMLFVLAGLLCCMALYSQTGNENIDDAVIAHISAREAGFQGMGELIALINACDAAGISERRLFKTLEALEERLNSFDAVYRGELEAFFKSTFLHHKLLEALRLLSLETGANQREALAKEIFGYENAVEALEMALVYNKIDENFAALKNNGFIEKLNRVLQAAEDLYDGIGGFSEEDVTAMLDEAAGWISGNR